MNKRKKDSKYYKKERMLIIGLAFLVSLVSVRYASSKKDEADKLKDELTNEYQVVSVYDYPNTKQEKTNVVACDDIPSGYTKNDCYAYVTWEETTVFKDRYITEPLTKLSAYETVKVIASMDSDSYVQLKDGTRGFILNKSLQYISDQKFGEVDLDGGPNDLGIIKVYENGNVILEGMTRPGDDKTPTPTNAYILGQEYDNYEMHGSYGSYTAKHATDFSGEKFFIHDGDLYSKNGSHGCLRTSEDFIVDFQEVTDPGMLLLVHK